MLVPPVRRRCCGLRSRLRCTALLCRRCTRRPLGSCGFRVQYARRRNIVETCTRPERVRHVPKLFGSAWPPAAPQLCRRIARLSPRFCATRTPGWSKVPRAERVIARTSSFSTRIVSNRRARSVVLLFHPISPPVCLSRFELRDRQLGALSAVGTRLGAREASLLPVQPKPLTRCKVRRMQQFPGGQRCRHRHTAIDTNNAAIAGRGDRVGDVREGGMPAPGPISRDAIGLHTR